MSNVVKPTIPAEVADAIEKARFSHWDNERIAYYVLNPDHTAMGLAPLRSIPFDTLLAALVNGYEREMTEEERRLERERKLARDYSYHRGCAGQYSIAESDEAFADGIKYALDTIGVKIEGVNT